MKRGQAGAAERLAALTKLVESELERALDVADNGTAARADAFGASRLLDSMRYSLRTPGKRLRPLLLLTTAEAVGVDAAPLARFCVGVEMIHAYSLIHDDLPAMDDDELRRGRPTNHVVYGDGMAILAGDGLLTEAFVAMLEPLELGGRAVDAALQMGVVRDLALAAGGTGMVGGQAADLQSEGGAPDEALLLSIHARKTGALILGSVMAGGRLAGATADVLDALERFAVHYGLAFQIADDIKDEVAPPEITGKRGGGDRAAEKMTYPALFGVDGSRERCAAELEAAFAALATAPGASDRSAALELLARGSVSPAFDAAGA